MISLEKQNILKEPGVFDLWLDRLLKLAGVLGFVLLLTVSISVFFYFKSDRYRLLVAPQVGNGPLKITAKVYHKGSRVAPRHLTAIDKIGWVIIHSDTLQRTVFTTTNTLEQCLEEPGVYTLMAEMYSQGSIVPIVNTAPVQVAVIDQNKPPVASLYTDQQDSSVYIGSYAVDPESALVRMAWFFDGTPKPDTVIMVDTTVECGFGFTRTFGTGKHFILLKVTDVKGAIGHATTSIEVE